MVLVVVGTGTEVGKTYVGTRLLRAAAILGATCYGYKPVESGLPKGSLPLKSDICQLAAASSFHVKHAPTRLTLCAPISPHLAARDEGVRLDTSGVLTSVEQLRSQVDLLLVELPGGALSPLTDELLGLDLARVIPHAQILLVASDRLGVLHDVAATTLACATLGAPIAGLVLSAPATPDASTRRNAAEIARVTSVPLLAELPRLQADAPLDPADPAFALARHFLTRR